MNVNKNYLVYFFQESYITIRNCKLKCIRANDVLVNCDTAINQFNGSMLVKFKHPKFHPFIAYIVYQRVYNIRAFDTFQGKTCQKKG